MENQHYVVCYLREKETWKINTMLYVIYVKTGYGKYTVCCMLFLRENGTWKINTMLTLIYVKAAHGKLILC